MSLFLKLLIKGYSKRTVLVSKTEEIFPSSLDPAEDGLRYTNAPDPENRETAILWELQVLRALDLPSMDLIWRMLQKMRP